MSGIEDTAQIPSVQQPKSGLPEGVDEFLASVDLPAVNPPPNWTGFTIKKISQRRQRGDPYLHFCVCFSSRYRIHIKQEPIGEVSVDGFEDGIRDKNDALVFLRQFKKEQPQIEIVFTVKPKSPGVRELIREGIKAIREEFFRL